MTISFNRIWSPGGGLGSSSIRQINLEPFMGLSPAPCRLWIVPEEQVAYSGIFTYTPLKVGFPLKYYMSFGSIMPDSEVEANLLY